uniref:Membrane protein US17 n=1 Tax=Panine betaherpesvirus 2 TaxID=188763 RepID=A0A8F7PQ15_9BETA|nr:membrane protein US17 [Panine betaherpesvirus 2]
MPPDHAEEMAAETPLLVRGGPGVLIISAMTASDVHRFLVCTRVYSTVAMQATCTFLLCLGMVLAFPHLESTVFLCCTGFMPPLSLAVPTVCLAVLHSKYEDRPPSATVLTIYSVVTTLSVVVASACSSSVMVVGAGVLACILFAICTAVACLGGMDRRRWQVIVSLYLLSVAVLLMGIYVQPMSLGGRLFLGYYVTALGFMLAVTAFDTSRLFDVSWREADLLALCLYENFAYLYLLLLILFTTQDSHDKLVAWMAWMSRSTGLEQSSAAGCDLLRAIRRNLTRLLA